MALFDFSLPASDPNNPNSAVTSAADYQRRLLLAQALQKQGADYSPVQSPWQGAARLADGLMGGLEERNLNAQQAAGQKTNAADWATALSGFGGASASPSAAASGGSSVPAFASSGSTGTPSAAIADALTGSAQKYGENPATLTNIAGIESRFDPNAKNPNSSASGLMQFTKGTAAQYGVTNPFDVNQSADGGARLLHANHLALASALGRDPTPGELYLAHQQGAAGAIKLLSNPDASAASLVGAQAVANNGGNPNMTAGDFAHMWTSRLDGSQPQGSGAPVQVASNNPNMPLPSSASAYAAQPSPAPAVAAISNASPAISVPGYDGTFTRAQANDADGVPSQAEWDAAAAKAQGGGQQVAAAAPAPSAAPSPAAAAPQPAVASSVNPQAIQAAQRILASPYATSAQQQVAQAIIMQAMKQGQPDVVAINNKLVDRNTGRVIGDYSSAADTDTNDIKNFRFAQQNGFKGSFTDFETQQKAQTQGNHVLGVGAALVGPDGKVLYQNAGAAGTMDDATAGNLADRMLAGENGVLVGLGRGAQGAENIAKVQKLLAAKMGDAGASPDAIAKARADVAGKMQEQRTLGTATANNTLYGDTAAAAMDTALQASAAVPRSQFKPLNQLMNMGMNAWNDPKYGAFLAATNTLVNEYAKATSPVGAPTDSQRNHAYEILSTADSPEKYDAVVRMMHKEIENTHAAIGQAHQQIKSGNMGTPPLQTPPPGGAPAAPAPAPGNPFAPSAAAAQAPSASAAVRVQTPEEAMKLPPGTQFVTPDGRVKIR